MERASKSFSVSLATPVAEALSKSAEKAGTSPGLKISEIVENYFLKPPEGDDFLEADAKADLELLRSLRDEAIEKLGVIEANEGKIADITLKTFEACQADEAWLSNYEKYVRGNPLVPGNARKTNANQTIGSRIKSKLGAEDLLDAAGKPQRGRAPVGRIIQSYQMLRW